jgi:phosphoribosylformylglycinamidine synthase
MKFRADIDVMPMEEILDPQGKVVAHSLQSLGLDGVEYVRIGKHVRVDLEAKSREEAEQMVDTACKKLLANLIMERYTFRLEEVK